MPGVVGIVAKHAHAKHERDVKAMIDCMMHEPFYKKGSYVNDALGVYIGWTCHEASYSDCMPIIDQEKGILLIFSGEHFGEGSGNRATSLLTAYDGNIESFLRRLNGSFCGVLIDLRKSIVILFNDRYGMHRVYCHEENEAVLFASEAKALLKVRRKLRSIDTKGLAELISSDCVLENRSLFSGVSLLPGGSVWTWSKGSGPTKDYYFQHADWETLTALEKDEFNARLEATFLKILPEYFREKGEVGMSLTGGLDSRMIMACLTPQAEQIPCYTYGGLRDTFDIAIGRKIAKVCHQTHKVIRLGSDFFSDFPGLAEKTIYLTDGNLGICQSHDLYFSKLVRKLAPIRVTGTFGSEVVRDHTMFNGSANCQKLFHPDLYRSVQQSLKTLSEMKQGHKLSVAVYKEIPWRNSRQMSIEQSQLTVRSPYLDNELVWLMYQAPNGMRASNEPQRGIIRKHNAALSAIVTDRGYSEFTNPLVAKIIELYFYALFKMDYTYIFALPQWLAKLDSMFISRNGRQVLGSQKFEYYRIWFRNQLSSYIKEVLLDRQTASRPYFDKKFIEEMLSQHIAGNRNYLNEINKAMSIELLHRLLIDA